MFPSKKGIGQKIPQKKNLSSRILLVIFFLMKLRPEKRVKMSVRKKEPISRRTKKKEESKFEQVILGFLCDFDPKP